ncbi:MAG TPA: hypothetical protein PK002_05185 [Cellvibrio sp.]|nr:hypothetical protein [Cellvibrio sp.]
MSTVSKIGFHFMAVTSLMLSSCATNTYMPPATGDLSTIKFELPQGEKEITIYEKPELCEGPRLAVMEKDETLKEVKVKRGESTSFTVNYVFKRQHGNRQTMTNACQVTYTLNATDKDYHLKYVVYPGDVCNVEAQRLAGAKRVVEPDMVQRESFQVSRNATTAPHCKPLQTSSEELVVNQNQDKKTPDQIAVEQIQPKIYPMQVKGVIFSIDRPLIAGEDVQTQQDKIFTLSNEDKENKSVRKYVKSQKSPDEKSTYILRSGMNIRHPHRLFDTYLEYKISANCQPQNQHLHCEYKAIDGFYSRDLPASLSLDGTQTVEQMEASEISILALLNAKSIIQTETFHSKLPLAQLQAILRKNNFGVKPKGSGLSLYRAKFNYSAELTQKKVKSGYMITASVEVNPIEMGSHHSDFVTPFNQAINDIKATVQ